MNPKRKSQSVQKANVVVDWKRCELPGCGRKRDAVVEYQGGIEWPCPCCNDIFECIHVKAARELRRRQEQREIDKIIGRYP